MANHRALLIGIVLIVAALALPLLAANPAAAVTPTSQITILYPKAGAVLSTVGTRISVTLTGFTLTSATGPCGSQTVGHYKIYVNDSGGANLITVAAYEQNASLWGLPSSTASLAVQLVCTDGTSLTPAVWTQIAVTAGEPQITLLSPSVVGGSLPLSTLGTRLVYIVSNFTLDPQDYGGPNIPGQGHLHFYYNNTTTLRGTGVYNYKDLTSLPAGPFKLILELHNNDHSLVTTASHPDGVNLTFNAVGTPPSIKVLSPASGQGVSNAGFHMQVAQMGFTLDPADYGGAAIPGQGHIHVNDASNGNALLATPTTTSFNLGALSSGTHALNVSLHNNDHTLVTDASHPYGFYAVISVVTSATGITILNPASGSQVSTLGARLVVAVSGFTLSSADYGGPAIPGEGHIHFYLDTVGSASLLGTSTNTTFNTGTLPLGTHTVIAELFNNDHTPLNPAVMDSVQISISAPAIAIVSPGPGAHVSSQGFRMVVAVSGFTLDPLDYAGSNVPGVGHIHINEGSTLLATAISAGFNVPALATGSHTLNISLHNNDHSPLSPSVYATITVVTGPPQIKVLEPFAGDSVSSLGFRVRVEIDNFTVDSVGYGGVAVPGQGHWHLNVGSTLITATAATSVVVTGRPVGSLTLNASLHNSDHTALSPAVFALLTVSVVAPSVTLSAPASTAEGQPLILNWTVTGFVLDSAAFGGAPEPGRGHVHVFLDPTPTNEGYIAATAGSTFVVAGLKAGTHTIKVELFNNDHTKLPTSYSDQVTVQVVAAGPSAEATVGATVFYATTGLLLAITVVLAVLLLRKGRGGKPVGEAPKPGTEEEK